jgi:hypothetical protein
MTLKWIFAFVLCLSLTACEEFAVLTTPKKQAIPSTSQFASQVQTKFWNTLHKGRYQDIPQANELLMAAYLQNPNDPVIAAHLGFLHIWIITERYREENIPATITNEILLAKNYFADAVLLDPNDARFKGFYGDSQLISGQIFHDPREETRGYFTLKSAIKAWPEFNYFTAGYPMSTLSPDSDNFKEALKWQWKTLDLCAGEKVNRTNPDFSRYLSRETQQGPKRACWNSWIAPYNFQGFFMNMGDMLVKSGDWQTGVKIYRNAQIEKHYSSWPFKAILEKKIAHAKENVTNFQQEYKGPDKTIMFNSGYGCMACHQQSR